MTVGPTTRKRDPIREELEEKKIKERVEPISLVMLPAGKGRMAARCRVGGEGGCAYYQQLAHLVDSLGEAERGTEGGFLIAFSGPVTQFELRSAVKKNSTGWRRPLQILRVFLSIPWVLRGSCRGDHSP